MSFGDWEYIEECIGEVVFVYLIRFNFTRYNFAEQTLHNFVFVLILLRFFKYIPTKIAGLSTKKYVIGLGLIVIILLGVGVVMNGNNVPDEEVVERQEDVQVENPDFVKLRGQVIALGAVHVQKITFEFGDKNFTTTVDANQYNAYEITIPNDETYRVIVEYTDRLADRGLLFCIQDSVHILSDEFNMIRNFDCDEN